MTKLNDDGGVWINIYKTKGKDIFWTGSIGYSSEDVAKKDLCDISHYIATINIKEALKATETISKLKRQRKKKNSQIKHICNLALQRRALLRKCYHLLARDQVEGGEPSLGELVNICSEIEEILK